MKLRLLAGMAMLFETVAAHGGVMRYQIDGKSYEGANPSGGIGRGAPLSANTIQRSWGPKYEPIRSPNSPVLACGSPGGPARLTAKVPAGSTITATWNKWPHNSGPLTAYMTECPGSCLPFTNIRSAKWFKIAEGGLISGTEGSGLWATGQMIKNNMSWGVKIPELLAPGNYLIRHETIALHRAPAEFYVNCANIDVTGSGTAVPPASARATLPGAYHDSDPGLTAPYTSASIKNVTPNQFIVPGPRVWSG